MELLIGFILGLFASVIASFIFTWFWEVFPLDRQRRIITFFRNPLLSFRLFRNTEERRIKNVLQTLFRSWCDKDKEKYLSCWADDCIRIMGSDSLVKEDKNAIAAKFSWSCQKYNEITVPVFVVEDIRLSQDSQSARAEVYYKFKLTKAEDSLPVIEPAREFYALRKRDDKWVIISNVDHFSEMH